MSKRPQSSTEKSSRDERLRAALRANLARRKAQGRARAAEGPEEETQDGLPGAAQAEAKADDRDADEAPHRPNQEK